MTHLQPKPLKAVAAFGLFFLAIAIFQSCKKNQNAPLTLNRNFNQSAVSYPATLNTSKTISEGLIAYWTFAKNTYDLSGNNNNGTKHAVTTTTDRFNHPAGAFQFNGTTSYVMVPDSVSLRLNNTDFTVNAWVNLNRYNSSFGSVILNKHLTGNNNGWAWSITGDTATTKHVQFFGPGGTLNDAYGSVVVPLNTWHMVTTIYSVGHQSLRFYVDGVLDDTVANIASPNALIAANLYIGRDNPSASANGYFFNGAMGDIRIYNRAINASEISVLFNATTAPTSGLLAFWPLTNTPNDLSGNGNNGTNNVVAEAPDRFGNPIGGYRFNGKNSYISVRDTAPLRLNNTNFTVNAWVKLTAYNSSFGSVILNKHITGNDNGWAWSITGDAAVIQHVPFFGPGGTLDDAYGSVAIPLNTWHMVTCIYTLSKSSLSFYVDGVFDHTVTGIASPNAMITAQLYIGRDNPTASANGYLFRGVLNDIRIYGRALSATEVGQLLNALD